MKNNLIFIKILCFTLLFVLDLKAQNSSKLPNDVRWVRESDEYEYLCKQTYYMAEQAILQNKKSNDQIAIVMDLDETVLDNSIYQVNLFKYSQKFNPESWNAFVKKEISTLVPGAKDFIKTFKEQTNGIIIYLSNRDAITTEATQNNLKKLGVLYKDDILLLRKDKADTKIVRRKEVIEGIGRMKAHGAKNVIAYFGDQMGDFPNDDSLKFTIHKFLFPNPMYGKW